MNKLLLAFILFAGSLAIGTAIGAEESTKSAALIVNATYKTGGAMTLRASAPTHTAAWFSKGTKIGVIPKGAKVKVVEVSKVSALFASQTWVKVVADAKSNGFESGWVYYGGADYLHPNE